MNSRKFKSGELVRHRSGQVMKVVNYIVEHGPWLGFYVSDNQVECAWSDENGQRKTKVFHHNALMSTETYSEPVVAQPGIFSEA